MSLHSGRHVATCNQTKMAADLGPLYKYAGFSGEGAFHVFQISISILSI